MNWRELKDSNITHVAGAVSGGLDSCTVTHWLKSKGFSVHCYTVDLGQPDEESLDAVKERMLGSGAESAQIVQGQDALAEAGSESHTIAGALRRRLLEYDRHRPSHHRRRDAP